MALLSFFRESMAACQSIWTQLDKRVWSGSKTERDNNPFGAEVSSLVLMLKGVGTRT